MKKIIILIFLTAISIRNYTSTRETRDPICFKTGQEVIIESPECCEFTGIIATIMIPLYEDKQQCQITANDGSFIKVFPNQSLRLTGRINFLSHIPRRMIDDYYRKRSRK